MATMNTNVASARRKCSAAGFSRLCEDYGLHPQHEDGATELRLSEAELETYGWQLHSEPESAALSC